MSPKSARKNDQQNLAKPENDTPAEHLNDITIVAIGASAGGIEAVTELMNYLQTDTGMAFVLVQHLDPKHHSILTELLARKTTMTVTEVSEGLPVKANHVYVIPPNATMSISNQTLHLSPREESGAMHMSVDYFMRALAEQKGNRAVGVILSGSGTDGTLGMAEIQAHGGMAFAQDEASAKYDGMPRSAVVAGHVDYVLSPKGIAKELARVARHPYLSRNALTSAADSAPSPTPGRANCQPAVQVQENEKCSISWPMANPIKKLGRFLISARGLWNVTALALCSTGSSLDGCTGALRHQKQNRRSVSQMFFHEVSTVNPLPDVQIVLVEGGVTSQVISTSLPTIPAKRR